MDSNGLTISNEDLADIFGGSTAIMAAQNPVGKEEAAPAAAEKMTTPAEKKGTGPAILTAKSDGLLKAQTAAEKRPGAAYEAQEENSVDDLIKRAQEIEKQMDKEEIKDLSFMDFFDERVVVEIISEFNDIRGALQSELAGRIDQKAVENMMLRTLEKTSNSFILLKNTNWDAEGRLRVNGAIDTARFIRNIAVYKDRMREVDIEIQESLKALLYMRLNAVKLGLGKEKYGEIKGGLIKRLHVAEGGYRRSTARFVKTHIVDQAIKKGDEEK